MITRWLLATAMIAALPIGDAEAKRTQATQPSTVRHQGPIGRVLSETAEVRSGAGFGFRVIAVVQRDDTVRMIERGKRGGWTRVQLDSGVVGWILTEQILLLTTGTGDDEKLGPFRRFGRTLRDKVLGPPNLLTARV
ncbi:MAG: SH3 domain-containing protein, partial [Deltaproteobacteria bacterium]|nr:SH3 domain-containing protein [Nannocystaceae bacterium]